MNNDEKAELRKVAGVCPRYSRGICHGCGEYLHKCACDDSSLQFREMATPDRVIALLDENARLAAEVDRLPKWIPCSERMPKPNRAVLIFGNNWPSPVVSKLIVDNLDGTPTCFSDSDGAAEIFYLDDVTHWMPLPEPPK